MSELKSRTFSVTATTVVERVMTNAKSLMPLDGDISIWYGVYTGTAAELIVEGMSISSGALIEHIEANSGIISIVSTAGTVKIHEVV